MKNRYPWQAVAVFVVLAASIPATAQVGRTPRGNCPKGTNFQGLGYTIRDARIEDPWRFLRISGGLSDAADQAVAALKNQRYNDAELRRVQDIVEAKRILPDADVKYSAIAVDNCSGKQVDVIFQVLSVQLSPAISSTFEFRQKEKTVPQDVIGISGNTQTLYITPTAGYDRSNRLSGGGRIELRRTSDKIPLNSFVLDGQGSSSMHSVEAALAGEHDSATSWLGHAEWRLDFLHASLPTASSPLAGGRLALQFLGETHPLKGAVFRLGTMVEGGNQQSSFSAAELSPQTVASTGYSSAKIYAGVTAHPRYQALALSYGLQLGSAGAGLHGDWRKHIGDLAYDVWLPVSDHRLFEVEQRLTAGRIEIVGVVPAAERFFGGNKEELFVPGESWQIRSNPVIRSIPANRFFLTSAGAGGDRFLSYNLTAAFTVWRNPIVPQELNSDPDFKKKLQGEIKSATSILKVTYESADPQFNEVRKMLPDIAGTLQTLSDAIVKAKTGAPASTDDAFQACSDAIDSSVNYVQHARDDKPVQAFGYVEGLLPDGDAALSTVVSVCGADLNGKLNNAAIASASNALDNAGKRLKAEYDQIDKPAAQTKADADMAYVNRTLQIILNELNIASVSPLLVFDTAHIGLSPDGTRYGVGGGIRFSLVNTVNFSAGYAWNPHRHPGEGTGAFFFSLSTRNLFQ